MQSGAQLDALRGAKCTFCVHFGCSLVDLFAFGCLVVVALPGRRGKAGGSQRRFNPGIRPPYRSGMVPPSNPGLREDAQTRPPSREATSTQTIHPRGQQTGAVRGQISAIWCTPGCIEGGKVHVLRAFRVLFGQPFCLWRPRGRGIAGRARQTGPSRRRSDPATLRPPLPRVPPIADWGCGRGRRAGLDVCASEPNLIRGHCLSSLLTTFSLRSQSEY